MPENVVAIATDPMSFPTATIVWIAFIIVWPRLAGYVVEPLVYGRAVNVNPRVEGVRADEGPARQRARRPS